ncbi:MAG TPA: YcjF family protein [Pirellulales bacterium]|nr:YcjF family protein [Pirellulales bacterium]
MPPEDLDDMVGIPVRAPRPVSQEPRTVSSASTAEPAGRNAADEAIPLGKPASVREVSLEVQRRRDEQSEAEEADAALQKTLRAETERAGATLRRAFRGFVITAVAVVAGLAGLMLCTQLIQAIQILTTWPTWLQVIGWLALGVCCLLLLWSLGRLLWFVARFRQSRPIARRLLDEREHLHELAKHVHAAAREQFGAFMREYPLDDAAQLAFLRIWGLSEREFEMMRRKRADLLEPGNLQDSRSWQESFETCFLVPLDASATKIIRRYAILTATKTAISPWALLDMAIVIYMGTSMLGSLCRVYQLRAGPLDMLYLFGLVMGQSFFAGELEEHSEEVASWLSDPVASLFHGVLGDSTAIDSFLPGVGKIAGKAGQGIANGLLLNRIGRNACKLLRPLSPA